MHYNNYLKKINKMIIMKNYYKIKIIIFNKYKFYNKNKKKLNKNIIYNNKI